jgi:hypothetical protein
MSSGLIWQQSRLVFTFAISITGIFLSCQFLNPTFVWVLTVDCECVHHCTDKKGLSSSARWSCMCALFCFLQLLTICNIIAIQGVKTIIESHVFDMMWLHPNQNYRVCATSFEQIPQALLQCCNLACTWNLAMSLACKHTWWTLSATQLHVRENYSWLAVNNLHPLLGKCKQFLFLGTIVW